MSDPLPFSEALDRFDPSAEPFANMTPAKLEEIKIERLRAHDLAGFWEADLHKSEKLPPIERYIHDLFTSTHGWLSISEKETGRPERGWTIRNNIAIGMTIRLTIEDQFKSEPFPDWTAEQSRDRAEEHGLALAKSIIENPACFEEYQAELERDNGGPFEMPDWVG